MVLLTIVYPKSHMLAAGLMLAQATVMASYAWLALVPPVQRCTCASTPVVEPDCVVVSLVTSAQMVPSSHVLSAHW